ncbi:hypothetical protein [Microvirga roseola]|uniref:hypothetical protein n=1 Tax=Microvirga roseola TaxID=2883126 RepID=UPI001E34F2B3|nr:hypothetical protein [Microvirga roseola]
MMRAFTHADGRLTDPGVYASFSKGHPARIAAEILLKGQEIPLPVGVYFLDKDGHERTNTRIRW